MSPSPKASRTPTASGLNQTNSRVTRSMPRAQYFEAAANKPAKGDNTGCLPLISDAEADEALRAVFAHGQRQGKREADEVLERNAYRSGFRWGLGAGLGLACISTSAAFALGLAVGESVWR